jgi:zona occludens toxin
MIHLTTGGNGTFKTLLTLKVVRDRQLAESRPVAYNGRFDLKPETQAAFGWKKVPFEKWQDEPDGTIFLIDECHNDIPTRQNGAPVPPHINMLSEHRKRGFDFYFCTIHPMNIDAFVRRHVQAPGWHRHHKRAFGAAVVSVLEWEAVNPACDRPGSGANGQVSTVMPPKEVYDWYQSATLHTAQKRIPRAVWIAGAAFVLVPALSYFAVSHFMARFQKPVDVIAGPGAARATLGSPRSSQLPSPGAKAAPLTQLEYMAARSPRIEGLAYTAPVYDSLMQPQSAPYPAACIKAASQDCTCYTQQGTRLPVPLALCSQIVAQGFFMEWAAPAGREVGVVPVSRGPAAVSVAAVAPVLAASAPVQAAPAKIWFPPEDSTPSVSSAQGAYDGRQIAAMRRGDRRAP